MAFNDPDWLATERGWLLPGLRRGDRRAFAALFETFAQPLYTRVLMPRLGDRQAAEDALADTFRAALENIDRYEDRGGSLWSWLAAIAANKAADLHRDRARGSRMLASAQSLLAPLLESGGSSAALQEEGYDRERLRAAVAAALAEFNPRYRRALELRFLEDRERAACADVMGVALGTFDVLLLRALRALRARWETRMMAGAGTATVTGRER